jgi:hypothetical protein
MMRRLIPRVLLAKPTSAWWCAGFRVNSRPVQRQIGEISKNTPGVELTFAIEGLSILDSTSKSNVLTVFCVLKPFTPTFHKIRLQESAEADF